MPFCLLFARNAIPVRSHRFQYAAPKNEPDQNRHARFRIDYEATQPISVERVEKQPWVLKTLALGTWCDVELMETLIVAFPRDLKGIWKDWNPKCDKSGQGFNLSLPLKQNPARFLDNLLVFEWPRRGFSIQYDQLEPYPKKYGNKHKDSDGHATAHMPRTEVLYQPPLVIIPQSPGDTPERPRAFISDRPLAFSQSYYGYSCAEHPEADTFASLLYLVAHSRLFAYYCLMTSRGAGFDRQTFNKNELESLRFPDVTTLSATHKASILKLAGRLESDEPKPWEEIDSFLFQLYGLDEDAAQIARDTLFAAASYRRKGSAAFETTTRQERLSFHTELSRALEPYFDVCGETVLIDEPDQPDRWEQPWFFLAISRANERLPMDVNLLRKAMEKANRHSASRILVRAPGKRGLLLGLLNQRRWWTVTRARLCGQHIVRNHLEAFGLTQQA